MGRRSQLNGDGCCRQNELDSRLERFDRCWHRGDVPVLEEFLPPGDSQVLDDADRRQLLIELVLIDLEYRWQRSPADDGGTATRGSTDEAAAEHGLPARPLIEDCAGRYPELGPWDQLPVTLITDEYRVRWLWGDKPELDTYLQRFPRQAQQLRVELPRIQRELDASKPSSGVHIRCPHCHGSVVLADVDLSDVRCPVCGSHFSLVGQEEQPDGGIEARQLGHFELLEQIGTGGFGTVWKARDHELDRVVAVKIPRRGQLAPGEVTMTVDGKVLGTPACMSPEQAKGQAHDADRRSDVYCLGVVLFELLTGEKPFRGNVRMMLHHVIHDDPPSLRRLNGKIHRDLETICLKCLEKEPRNRYNTSQELADELRRFLRGEPIQARSITRLGRAWRWCRRYPMAATVIAMVALVAVVAPLVALNQATLAASEAAAREQTRQQRYVADMVVAQQAWEAANVGWVRQLLARHVPGPRQTDLRGFQWYHLWQLCQRGWVAPTLYDHQALGSGNGQHRQNAPGPRGGGDVGSVFPGWQDLGFRQQRHHHQALALGIGSRARDAGRAPIGRQFGRILA